MDAVTYALAKKVAAGITPGYSYKGSVTAETDLPANAEQGDLYTVTGEDNAQYVWDGEDWIKLNGDLTQDVSQLKNAITSKASAIYNTASGDIASFADGADGMPIKHLIANIEAVQSGTGDPSPDNVRPITGWTGLNGARFGINQLPRNAVDETRTHNGITITAKNGVYKITGTSTGGGTITFDLANSIDLRPALNKIQFFNDAESSSLYTELVRDSTRVHYWLMNSVNRVATGWTDTGNEVVNKIAFTFDAGQSYNLTISPVLTLLDNNVPAFVPYVGNDTISVSWATEAGTVYGCTLDVVTGVLAVTDAEIASYNGETLPSTWISDRDVYAAGTTPTIGAQVVYKLATPQTYQLDPVIVTTLLGNNTVYVDCGSVTVDYPADTKLYVDNKIAEAVAAALNA